MTIIRRYLFCMFGLVSCLAYQPALADDSTQLLDRVVAVVNDDVITLREYEHEIASIKAKISAQGKPLPPEPVLRKQALRRVILIKLQMNEARRLGIEVDDATLAAAINSIAQRNDISREQLKNMLAEEGMDFDSYREELRQQITLTRLHKKQVTDKIQIRDAQIDAYLANNPDSLDGKTSVKLSHILLATPEDAGSEKIEQQRQKAEQLKARLLGGEDFATAAVNLSDGRQALNGGDMGWLDKEHIPEIFLQSLAGMQRGDIAGPIQSSSGFHIIKLEDYKGGERELVDQTHARHILIRTNELTSDTDARNRLEQLYNRIEQGDKFETLARSHSDDKTSAIKGGDLGWISPGDLVPEFEKNMDSLPIGGLSKPFRTQFGWHIVQVLDRRSEDVTSKARREKIREILRNQRTEEALEIYLRKLMDQAYIEEQLNG